MNQTFENVKYILSEDLNLKVTPVEQDNKNFLAVDLLFTKSNLKMFLITDIQESTVILNFLNIDYVQKDDNKLRDFESYLEKTNDINVNLKHGKFFIEWDKNKNLRLSYRMSVMFENELSKNLYKKALFTSLKTIDEQINKILEG